jgi:hypothetical protein
MITFSVDSYLIYFTTIPKKCQVPKKAQRSLAVKGAPLFSLSAAAGPVRLDFFGAWEYNPGRKFDFEEGFHYGKFIIGAHLYLLYQSWTSGLLARICLARAAG